MRHGVARVVYGAGSLSLSLYIINRVAPHCVDTLMMTPKRENAPNMGFLPLFNTPPHVHNIN